MSQNVCEKVIYNRNAQSDNIQKRKSYLLILTPDRDKHGRERNEEGTC